MKYSTVSLAWKGGKVAAGGQIDESQLPWRLRQKYAEYFYECSDAHGCGYSLHTETETKECPECSEPLVLLAEPVLVDRLPDSFIAARKSEMAARIESGQLAQAQLEERIKELKADVANRESSSSLGSRLDLLDRKKKMLADAERYYAEHEVALTKAQEELDNA